MAQVRPIKSGTRGSSPSRLVNFNSVSKVTFTAGDTGSVTGQGTRHLNNASIVHIMNASADNTSKRTSKKQMLCIVQKPFPTDCISKQTIVTHRIACKGESGQDITDHMQSTSNKHTLQIISESTPLIFTRLIDFVLANHEPNMPKDKNRRTFSECCWALGTLNLSPIFQNQMIRDA